MNEHFNRFASQFVEFLAVYWLHSTFIILLTCLFAGIIRNLSAGTKQRIWQFACVSGMATALLQTLGLLQIPIQTLDFFNSNPTRQAVGSDAGATDANLAESPSNRQGRNAASTKVFDSQIQFPGTASRAKNADLPVGNDEQAALVNGNSKNSNRLGGQDRISLVLAPDFSATSQRLGDSNSNTPRADSALIIYDQPAQEGRYSLGLSPSAAISLATLLIGWILIGIGITLWQLAALWRREKSFGECRDPRVLQIFNRFLSTRKIKTSIHLLESETVNQPMAFGWLCKKIVVNPAIGDQLDDEEIESLLAHEVAHLVRGDWFWLVVGQFFCTSLALQPLHFLARKQWLVSGEEACDQWAVRQGVEPIALAKCLTKIAEWQSLHRPAFSLAASGSSTVMLRVESLLRSENKRTSARKLIGIIGIGFLFTLLALLPSVPVPKLFSIAGRPGMPEPADPQLAVPTMDTTTNADRPESSLSVSNFEDSQMQSESDLLKHWHALNSEMDELKSLIDRAESLVPDDQPNLSEMILSLRKRLQSLDSRREAILEKIQSL